MPAANLQHRRAHNLLLVTKLLNGRDSPSPFTLVIDSLEQSGKPLLRELIRRAKLGKIKVLYVSFETLRQPTDVDVFVSAHALDRVTVQKELTARASPAADKYLLVIDSLNVLASTPALDLSTYLSSLLNPQTSLLAIYHSDVPHPNTSFSSSTSSKPSPYSPHPLTLLKYLATTILTPYSLSQVLARKAARDRSLAEPLFGLAEEKDGIVTGLGGNDARGVVFEMEYRRKSGRGIREWFYLPSPSSSRTVVEKLMSGSSELPKASQKVSKESVILLEDHPLYRSVQFQSADRDSHGGEAREGMGLTFNLGLTEKQRRDREGVVLPYLDAQREEGVGEGGRILYDMGEEDDFDDEEDEI